MKQHHYISPLHHRRHSKMSLRSEHLCTGWDVFCQLAFTFTTQLSKNPHILKSIGEQSQPFPEPFADVVGPCAAARVLSNLFSGVIHI